MNYKEQLKSPYWQRKRLEVLNRDDFTCQNCGNKENTLHVHHIKYANAKRIWDIDSKYLITLCDDCHKIWHQVIKFNTNHPNVDLLLAESLIKFITNQYKDEKISVIKNKISNILNIWENQNERDVLLYLVVRKKIGGI